MMALPKIKNNGFLDDVLRGLGSEPKTLQPKYLYDERGAELFEKITELPEYYVTRTELDLLNLRAEEISETIGSEATLYELGSGSLRKIRILLNHFRDLKAYVPIDISQAQLFEASQKLHGEYPNLKIIPICSDFTSDVPLPEVDLRKNSKKVFFFPGSTLGNFERKEAQHFLKKIRSWIGKRGGLLIGVDLKKELSRLLPAYDDAQGVTAEFNLNILARINRELGANFDLEAFRHRTRYHFIEDRVEMHLESLKEQTVTLGDFQIHFKPSETIHTESSYKYSIEGFRTLARNVGFTPVRVWTDEKQLISVHYLSVD
jgi:dimethylhistidine N-methyltransferase